MALSSGTISLTGGRELEKKLQELTVKTQKKIVRKAVRAGVKLIQKQVKINARSMVGGEMGKEIARAIIVRAGRQRKKGYFNVATFVDGKKNDIFVDVSKKGKRNYIPAAIEYGHGNVSPIPFTRKAFETKRRSAVSALTRTIAVEIEKEGKA